MPKLVAAAPGSVLLGLCLMIWVGCGGGGQKADDNLPVRRAKMREIKLSTDRIMVALKNETLDGVEADAKKIQDALSEVTDLFPPEHKEKYQTYNQESQVLAMAIANAARSGSIKIANKNFRSMVPYCGKCHEDCAFMVAPGFPEYEH